MDALEDCAYGEAIALPSCTFERAGYSFTGWNDAADGSGTAYADEAGLLIDTEDPRGNLTLYAQWTADVYDISYVLNGGTNDPTNPATYTTETQTIVLSAPTRTGHTFDAWFEDAELTRTVTSIDRGSVGSRTFYAGWTANSYTIRYAGNGATSGQMSSLAGCRYDEEYSLAANAFKRTGYAFSSWNTKADGSGRSFANRANVKNLSSKNGATVTLYAQWRTSSYDISYVLNGGTNSTKNPSTYKVTTSTITLASPNRTGYKFGGWYKESSFKTRVKSIPKGSTGSKTLYAKWTPIQYTITYKLNGGKNNTKNPSTYTIVTAKVTLASPTRTGYTFLGWYTSSSYKTKVTTIAKGSKGNKTFYAKWKANTYTIRYAGNGATTGSMASQTNRVYGSTYTLAANAFRRTNHVFRGWNTKTNGTGTSYGNMARVKNLTSAKNGTVTLYAQWESMVSTQLHDTDYGGVAIIRNNNSYSVELTATFLYYRGSTLVDTKKEYVYCLEGGRSCAVQGWIWQVDYTSVRVQVTWERASSSIIGNASRISTSSNFGSDNVMVTVRNNGSKAGFTKVAVVFYKGSRVVGFDDQYADVDNPGSVDYLEFRFPHTTSYETIRPTSYKVYVNESYRYNWSR